jgi:hypothetical protein
MFVPAAYYNARRPVAMTIVGVQPLVWLLAIGPAWTADTRPGRSALDHLS